jgi:hypothetical protein
MSLSDEEFDMLGEDELALLTRRFERMHQNPVREDAREPSELEEEHKDMLIVR